MQSLILSLLTAEPDAALMQKLVARQAAVQAWTDNARVVLEVRAEELSSEGKIESTEVTRLRVAKEKGEPVAQELLSKIEDGKDVTAAAKKELEEEQKGEKKKGSSMGAHSPFRADQLAKYRFTMLVPPREGAVRVGFEPAAGKDPELMTGEATFEVETGDVLSMSMHPSKNPTFVDALQIECEFGQVTPAGRALSRMTAKGAGGLLFIKKRFAVLSTFTDWAPTRP